MSTFTAEARNCPTCDIAAGAANIAIINALENTARTRSPLVFMFSSLYRNR
jgi:hypothetical protein